MQVISQEFISRSKYNMMFQVLRNGGFVSLGGQYGVMIEQKPGYVIWSLVVKGQEVSDKILANMSSSYQKKIKTPIKETVDEGNVETEEQKIW